MHWILVAIGGALGALSRAGLVEFSGWLKLEERFPCGTLMANLAGCLLVGFAMTLAVSRMEPEPAQRLTSFFIVGFLGSLTTFSAFAWQSNEMLTLRAIGPLALNVSVNLVGGLLLVMAGIWLAKTLIAR